MTLSLSPAALFVLMVLCVPFLWSGLVALLRRICAGETSLSDQQERAVLVLMVLPVFCGLAVVFLPGLMPHIPSPLPPMGEPQQIGGLGVVVAEETAAPGFNLMPWVWATLILFYLAGAALGLGRFARGYVRMREILRHSIGRDAVGDVRLTGAPVSPFATPCGRVILPSAYSKTASEEETALIIAHERAHIARRDPFWFLILAAADAVFWFNPFIRVQTSHCRLAAELDCDARVLGAAPQMRKAYAATLIRVLKHTAGAAPTCAPAVLSPRTKGDIRVRLGDIMQPKPRRRNRRATAVLAALGLVLAPLSAWQIAHAAEVNFTVRPLEGHMSSPYGERVHPINKKPKMHKGTDIAAPLGTPIYAPASGKVLRVTLSDAGYGNMLELDHGDGVITRYAQLDTIVADGKATVRAGELIARVGASGQATGPHLHVEVIVNGEHVDPATVLDLPGPKVKPHKD
ncbi:M23/M56 family metallopeptidase [Parvularcula marina]|uniref:M23/M56 family metallopeptidase n=1 Tax=Parvularcula marina TaxID=2292771 RepID=UPI0035172761